MKKTAKNKKIDLGKQKIYKILYRPGPHENIKTTPVDVSQITKPIKPVLPFVLDPFDINKYTVHHVFFWPAKFFDVPRGNPEKSLYYGSPSINYIREGRGLFYINSVPVEYESNSLIAVPGNAVISLQQSKSTDFMSLLFTYKRKKPKKKKTGEMSALRELFQKTSCQIPSESRILGIIFNCWREMKNSDQYSKGIVQAYFFEILTCLQRLFNIEENERITGSSAMTRDRIIVKEFLGYLRDNCHSHKFDASAYMARFSLHPNVFRNKFKKITGHTISDAVRDLRIKRAERLLVETYDSMRDIAHKSGIRSYPHFFRDFKRKYGMTPGQYRERHINQF